MLISFFNRSRDKSGEECSVTVTATVEFWSEFDGSGSKVYIEDVKRSKAKKVKQEKRAGTQVEKLVLIHEKLSNVVSRL